MRTNPQRTVLHCEFPRERQRTSCPLRPTLLVLLAICVPAWAESPGQRFAWPDGTRAEVHVSAQGERDIPGEPHIAWDCAASFVLRASRQAEALQIQRSDHSGWKCDQRPALLPDLIVDFVPTIVASSDGAFLDAQGYDAARTRIVEDLGGHVAAADRPVFDLATSDDALRAMVMDHWNIAVGVWTGFEGPIGEPHRQRHATPIPQLGGGVLDLVLELTATRRSSCSSTTEETACIEFRLISRPDVDQTSEIMAQFLDKAGVGEVVVTAFDMVNEAHSLLARDTMLPHSIKMRRTSTVELARKGTDERATSKERSERSYRFVYGAETTTNEPGKQ